MGHWNWGLILTGIGAFTGFGLLLLAVGKIIVNRIEVTRKQNDALLLEQRRFKSVWEGEPAQPGVPARPGVPERLERIENNTSGLPDRMVAAESRLGKQDERMDLFDHRLALVEEHILRRPS